MLNTFQNDLSALNEFIFGIPHISISLFNLQNCVRNGEAVGLRVGHVDFIDNSIAIKEVMERNEKTAIEMQPKE